MIRLYPVIFTKTNKEVLVEVPDFDAYTEGKDMKDAIFMARDLIGLLGSELLLEHKKLPIPSEIQNIKKGTFSKEGTTLKTILDVDIENYAERESQKTVRRNVSIPKWLDIKANEMQINVSKILTEALTKKVACL